MANEAKLMQCKERQREQSGVKRGKRIKLRKRVVKEGKGGQRAAERCQQRKMCVAGKQRDAKKHKVRQREVKSGKGRQREAEVSQQRIKCTTGKQREVKKGKVRQNETERDKGRQMEVEGSQQRKTQGGKET